MVDMEEPIPGQPEYGHLAPLLSTPLPLFPKGGPNARTVVQQRVTNCPLPALLAAMAHAMPARLSSMIEKESPAAPRSSYFFGSTPLKSSPSSFAIPEVFRVAFQHSTIEISPLLYMDERQPHRYKPRFAMAADDSGWVSYIEKAYVVYRCKHKYSNLDFLGSSGIPLTVARVVEDVAHDFDWFRLTERQLWLDPEPHSFDPPPGNESDEIFELDERRIVAFRSKDRVARRLRDVFGDHNTRATIVTTHNHTLAVVGYNDTTREVTLYDAMRKATLPPMNLSSFLRSHDAVYQVR
jgi:hypothetical protein